MEPETLTPHPKETGTYRGARACVKPSHLGSFHLTIRTNTGLDRREIPCDLVFYFRSGKFFCAHAITPGMSSPCVAIAHPEQTRIF
jgi:hypothetical protein